MKRPPRVVWCWGSIAYPTKKSATDARDRVKARKRSATDVPAHVWPDDIVGPYVLSERVRNK